MQQNNSEIKLVVSVIVPIYNVEKYLSKCIDSILRQTYMELEIILIDDGSPDHCPHICDDYSNIDARIIVIHQKNQGLSGARNAGIQVATGDYLMFVDSDDYIELTMIEEMLKYAIENECSLVACGRTYVYENGNRIQKTKEQINYIFDFKDALKEMNSYDLFDMSAWGKLYKKDLWNDMRFPVGKLSEDFFVMYRIIEMAQQVGFMAKPFYNYLQRKNSISKNRKINEDFIEAARYQMEFLDSTYPELSDMGHVAYASAVLTVYDLYIKNSVVCPQEKLNCFKEVVQKNLKYLDTYSSVSFQKKFQLKLFLLNAYLYRIIFKLYRRIRRV